jgi:MerR family transcriptional regulator, copper efflux regulator
MSASDSKLLRVGELAKCTGKTVRAVHLYEELGLLRPAMRTEGGFRLYHPDAAARIDWVVKLQAIGFTLSEIQDLVKEFEGAPSGRAAAIRARGVFADKLCDIRKQIASLQVIENDIVEALGYLDACQDCSLSYRPTECSVCSHQGHERGCAPPLFANLSCTAAEECGQTAERAYVASHGPMAPMAAYDVAATELRKPPNVDTGAGVASGGTVREVGPEATAEAGPVTME